MSLAQERITWFFCNQKTRVLPHLHTSPSLKFSTSVSQIFSWWDAISLFQVRVHTMQLFLFFPVFFHQHVPSKLCICCKLLFQGIKPYCCIYFFISFLSLFFITLSQMFIEWLICFTPPKLHQFCTAPLFLKIIFGVIFFHSSGICLPSNNWLNVLVNTFTAKYPKHFHASTGVSSGPSVFPFFIYLIALWFLRLRNS